MNSHPRKREGLTEQRIGDELYLFAPNGEKLIVLNATSMLIWSLCDGDHGLTEMTTALHDIFREVSSRELSEDIEQCLAQFQRERLLADETTGSPQR